MQVRRGIKKAWGVGAVRWLNKSVPAAEWPALVVYHSAVREADKGAGGGSRGRRGCLPQQQVQRSSGTCGGRARMVGARRNRAPRREAASG